MGRSRSLVSLLALLLASACSDRATIGGEDGTGGDGGTGDDGGPGDDGDGGDPGDDGDPDDDGDPTAPPPLGPREVDILFVIDNSGSMGEEQGALVAGLASLVNPLEDAGVGYRIGITTTDNGNPWCSGTTPEGGAMRLSSCLARLEEFIFNADPPTDKQDVGCRDFCKLEEIPLLPTETSVDPTPKLRPWIERIDGVSNLEGDVAPIDALACALPQGINGCGFESHLESMYKGLKRTADSNENSYGFMRDEAHLMVVIVSDEVDCSYSYDYDSIFKPEGGRTFWSDPDSAYPTSAVCWNAGVACTGGPGTYDDCRSENKDVDGNPTGEGTAVLRPVSRYRDLLQGIEALKREQSRASVMVAGIVGVPSGYEDGQEIVYQDTQDAVFQGDFGIGPGCSSAMGVALPPVRMRELAESFERFGRNLYSVCEGSYASAVAAIAETILAHVE